MDSPTTPDPHARAFPVSNRMVLAISVPITLAYITTPLLGLVDTAVVGRLGDAALIGGLAIGSTIISLVFTTFNFQRSGTTGLAAQAVGTGDEKEKQAILYRALILACVIGVMVIALSPILLQIGLWFMAPGADVADATRGYFLIRIWSTPFALGNYAFLGWLIGLGHAGKALALQILLNGCNIVLSILLGLYLDFGLVGVAAATVVAELLASLAGGWIAMSRMDPTVRPSLQRIRDIAALRRLVNLNGDIMIRSFVLLAAFAFFTAQGAQLGELTLAANAILLQFFLVGGYFLDGMATASEQIVGRAVGALYRPSLIQGIRLTLLWSILQAAVLAGLFWIGGGWVIEWITTIEPVRETARQYLLFAALTPLTGVLAFHMDGVYIGATWSRTMSTMMLLSAAVYVGSYYLVLQPSGNTGLWLALHIFFVCRGLTLALALPSRIRKTFG